jgi:uncharacterized membrane protein
MARTIFRTELTPNSSASPQGLRVLAMLLGGLAALTAGAFALLGAWPVLPFMGLEVGAALLLLRWHRRSALREREVVELTERALLLTRTDRRGRVRHEALEPYWLRVELGRLGGRPRVLLRSHGRVIPLGASLTAEENRELHLALSDALARWRDGCPA